MLLDKKSVLKIWLNPRLNLTIIQGTGSRNIIKPITNEHYGRLSHCALKSTENESLQSETNI